MASQTKGPGTTADDSSIGAYPWYLTDYAKLEDGLYSEAFGYGAAGSYSHYLLLTNFDFSLPACTIAGISVRMKRAYDTSYTLGVQDYDIRLVKAGAVVGDNKAVAADWPNSLTNYTFGGAADLWGTTWTANDINNSGFGFAVSVWLKPGSGTAGAEVDYVEITVTYTPITYTPVFSNLQEDDTAPRLIDPTKYPYYLGYRKHRKQGAALVGYLPRGDAASGRSVGNKLDEVPSVKDWGVKGDGATDDTAAIQAAIDAVYVGDGGGTIRFPHGQYKVSSTVTVRDYVRLVGGDAVGAGDYSRSCGFRVYTGRAAANTYAFNMKVGSGMRGFHFWYPGQISAAEPTPVVYGWTIGSSTTTDDTRDCVYLQDLFFLNSYAAIRLYNCNKFIVERIYGQPICTGIYADYCLSPCTLRDVRFDTFYAATTDSLYTWIHANARAFDIRQVQGLFAYNLQAKGYYEGFYLNHASLRMDLFGVDVQTTTYPFQVAACDDVGVHGGLLMSGESGVVGISCANPLTGYLGLFGLRCFDQGGESALITNTSGKVEVVGCV